MRVSGAEEFELSEFVFDIVGYTEFISIFFWGGRGAGVESVGEGVCAPAHLPMCGEKVLGMISISASFNARLCVHRSASGFALDFLGCFCFLVSSKAEMFLR